MLETLIPSRIRRTLLEYILAHPDERFYLRGLAKTLNLSVSPARRELLRLEQLGMLAAYEEGNMRFYVVNQSCPEFLQLSHASAKPSVAAVLETIAPLPAAPASVEPARSAPAHVAHRLLGRLKVLVGAFVLLASLAIVFGGIVYTAMPRPKTTRQLGATSVTQLPASAQTPASGEMRSSRWRLTPGAVGGGWSQ